MVSRCSELASCALRFWRLEGISIDLNDHARRLTAQANSSQAASAGRRALAKLRFRDEADKTKVRKAKQGAEDLSQSRRRAPGAGVQQSRRAVGELGDGLLEPIEAAGPAADEGAEVLAGTSVRSQ